MFLKTTAHRESLIQFDVVFGEQHGSFSGGRKFLYFNFGIENPSVRFLP